MLCSRNHPTPKDNREGEGEGEGEGDKTNLKWGFLDGPLPNSTPSSGTGSKLRLQSWYRPRASSAMGEMGEGDSQYLLVKRCTQLSRTLGGGMAAREEEEDARQAPHVPAQQQQKKKKWRLVAGGLSSSLCYV
eukprot:gene10186-7134_t